MDSMVYIRKQMYNSQIHSNLSEKIYQNAGERQEKTILTCETIHGYKTHHERLNANLFNEMLKCEWNTCFLLIQTTKQP